LAYLRGDTQRLILGLKEDPLKGFRRKTKAGGFIRNTRRIWMAKDLKELEALRN